MARKSPDCLSQKTPPLNLRSSPGPKNGSCIGALWKFLGGWDRFFDFWIAPQETFALFRYWDQTEFGFEWVDITPQGIQQDVSAGFFFEGTNNGSQPAFSPNGQLWACAYMDDLWWVADPEDPDFDQPARGGEYHMGALLIFEGKKRPPRSIPLVVTIPPGWLPAYPERTAGMILIADPLFLDDQRIQIQLPSGEVQVHQL